MKKLLIIPIILIVLIISIVIGYNIVSGNEEVFKEPSLITVQNEITKKISTYGYTIDNPNLIINPYNISPLTALIIFETKKEEEITITIHGKNPLTTYTHTFDKNDKHYIPVYGLYPDYDNQVTISYGDKSKTINIKTDPLPQDFIMPTQINKNEELLNNELYFFSPYQIGYPCAYDTNGEVRWYLTKSFLGKINYLNNGHLLLGSNKLINDFYHSTSLLEIDLLGKIYYEYNIPNGYHHNYFEIDNGNLLVLSNKNEFEILEDYVIEIDRKNGNIVNEFNLNEIAFELNIPTTNYYTNKLPLYKNTKYINKEGIRLGKIKETKTSSENITLINYRNKDKEYEKHNIKIIKEEQRLVVTGSFNKNDKVKIILDKFLGKKIYDLKVSDLSHVTNNSDTPKEKLTVTKYINYPNLDGKYSIYISINNKIYKTNNFVIF